MYAPGDYPGRAKNSGRGRNGGQVGGKRADDAALQGGCRPARQSAGGIAGIPGSLATAANRTVGNEIEESIEMQLSVDDLKEAFRLWWEFLRLSKGYKEFCRIIDHDDFEAFMKFKKKYSYLINGPLKSITYELDFDLIWDYQNCDIQKGRLPGEIPLTYTKFGNIYNKTFDSFWEDKGCALFYSSPIGMVDKSITKFINLLELFRDHYFDPIHNPYKNNDAKEFSEGSDRLKAVASNVVD